MQTIESREISNRKYLSKTILNGKPRRSKNSFVWHFLSSKKYKIGA